MYPYLSIQCVSSEKDNLTRQLPSPVSTFFPSYFSLLPLYSSFQVYQCCLSKKLIFYVDYTYSSSLVLAVARASPVLPCFNVAFFSTKLALANKTNFFNIWKTKFFLYIYINISGHASNQVKFGCHWPSSYAFYGGIRKCRST